MKRAVSRIVSPGTLINDEGINNTNSFVLLIAPPSETNRSDKISSSSSHSATAPFGICWYDINTGELFYSQSCLQQLSSDLARISPVEIVLYDQAPEASSHIFLHLETTKKSNPDQHSFKITFLDSSHFDQSQLHDGHQRLSKLAGTTTTTTINSNIKLLSLDMSRSEELAVISMLNFLEYSFQGIFDHAGRWIQFPVKFDSQDCMKMDHAVVRALELNRTMNQGRQKGSVIQVLDETKTAQGSRMLQSRLSKAEGGILTHTPPFSYVFSSLKDLHALE